MRKKPLIISASVLLLINAVGALYGGGNFILHPDGSGMQISLDMLKSTPFENYLIPGIILFILNGLLSLIVLITIMLNHRYIHLLILAQGIILVGWISIQVVLIQILNIHHFVFWSFGVALIIIGLLLKRFYHENQAGN